MGWLSGWIRRKQLNVNGIGSSFYQMKITVYYGIGTDSAGNIYCNNNCNTDFSDIRFTDSGGSNQLNYWIESSTTSSNAKIWIKIPANSTYIYIYYNNINSGATTSNGTNTFVFFDDFNGSSYTNKWTLATKCTYATLSETGGVLSQGSCYPKSNCTGGASSCAGSCIYNSINVVSGTAIQFYIPSINSEGWQSYELDFACTGSVNINTGCGTIPFPNDCYRLQLYPSTIYLYRDDNNSSTNVGSYSIGVQGLYILIKYIPPNITVYTSTDNQTWTSRISYSSAASKTGIIWLLSQGCGDRYGLINWDNLYVRTFSSPEPTWGTISAEQNAILNITSTPTGAEIWIAPHGGSYVDQILQTNSYTGIAPGTYDIKLTLAGYQDWYLLNQTFITGQTYNIIATLSLLPGTLAIYSTPTGSSIYIDGSPTSSGTTAPGGTTLTNISVGIHSIRLSLAGYIDWTGSATVNTQATTTIRAVFAGSANITSTPSNVSIYLDGSPTSIGNTPLTITNLTSTTSDGTQPTQSHTYILRLTGYADTSGSFTATAGTTINIPVTLPGSLYITSIPTGAQIYIDGILQS